MTVGPEEAMIKKNNNLTPAYRWCCVASVTAAAEQRQQQQQQQIKVERVHDANNSSSDDNDNNNNSTAFRTVQGRTLDITNSPDWMEYIELLENRTHESGGAGAYDTYRCDLVLGIGSSTSNSSSSSSSNTITNPWRIWGQDFHLTRLQESYRSIAPVHHQRPKFVQVARQASERMVRALLQEAEGSPTLQQQQQSMDDDDTVSIWEDVPIQLVRVTLLWSPPHKSDPQDIIVVRGHACSSGKPLAVHQAVQPIVASIAAKQHESNHTVDVDTSMPSRLLDPQHKIASWTRLRKKMERPETYKPPGVSEVLMVRPANGGRTEVLEGTSSNVFVIYKDGTLRTAKEGVLYGYARHLVLECAESCGLQVDFRPILLQDAEKGLWEEAFITSSSRLIYPISKVLMHTDHENEFVEYWRDPALVREEEDGVAPFPKPKWRQMLDKILEKPYPRVC